MCIRDRSPARARSAAWLIVRKGRRCDPSEESEPVIATWNKNVIRLSTFLSTAGGRPPERLRVAAGCPSGTPQANRGGMLSRHDSPAASTLARLPDRVGQGQVHDETHLKCSRSAARASR